MPTPGTSGWLWSSSAEVRERLQAVQREGRRTVQANKLKRIQEEEQERLRRAEEEEQEDQQKINIQNFKQQDHISLRLRHTRAGQAMRKFSARGKARAKAGVDGLRAQQDELAHVSAQQDLDRLMLQHDLANQIRATRRTALEEQARQAEEDRLRVEREQADQDEAASLSDADVVLSSRSTGCFLERQGFLWGGEFSLSKPEVRLPYPIARVTLRSQRS
ncbi:hypothetical protein KCU77_g15589, partial [Aureobasidium melanogenum]